MTEQQPITAHAVDARYNTEGLPSEYLGNPLIEALPGIISHQEVIENLRELPAFDASERSFSSESRLHFIARLFWHFFQPLEQHIRIWDYLSICIRQGYIRRNPLNLQSVQVANELYAAAMEHRDPVGVSGDFVPNSVGFAVIGVSGIGKSTAISSMLNRFPQVIQHHSYHGKPLEMKQIVWLKMDCSHNGSERGFCLSFLSQVDQLVGTSYYPAYEKRATADTLLTTMRRIAHSYNLGVLLVDEIQHLANSNRDSQKLLNFFVTLENTIGVPVILLGTPGALPLLQGEFRAARRCCAHGDVFWNPLQWDSSIKNSEWEMFLSRMWHYQWIRKPVDFSAGFAAAMYEETQGIEALAVILFMLLQEQAVRSGEETFTVEQVSRVARQHMNIVQPMLDALRSKDPKKIAKYSDIISVFINENQAEHSSVTVLEAAKEKPSSAEETLVSYLVEMEIRPEKAEQYARQVIQKLPSKPLMVQLREAILLRDKDEMSKDVTAKPANESLPNADDIRNYASYQEMDFLKGDK